MLREEVRQSSSDWSTVAPSQSCESLWGLFFPRVTSKGSGCSNPFSPSLLPSGNHVVTNFFSPATFKSLYLSLTIGLLIMICLGVGLFASIITGTLCASWTCKSVSFTKSGKFSFTIFQMGSQFIPLSLLLLTPL